jgi:hypothetical protein
MRPGRGHARPWAASDGPRAADGAGHLVDTPVPSPGAHREIQGKQRKQELQSEMGIADEVPPDAKVAAKVHARKPAARAAR